MLFITESLQLIVNHGTVPSAGPEPPEKLHFAQVGDSATTAKHQFFSVGNSGVQLHVDSHFLVMHVNCT